MNKKLVNLILFSCLFIGISCNSPQRNENVIVLMKTSLGDIKMRLYDDTPLHRDNFIRLVNKGFYEGISFHRVIDNFMIQAGDPSTRSVKLPASADSLNTYTIPSEFHEHHFHKKGALAAAREGNDVNPEMRSSGTHFYIVKGTRLTDNELDNFEKIIDNNIKQGMFTRLIRQVSDSARLSGNPLSDAEVNEIASVRMFEFLSMGENYNIPEDQRIAYKTEGGVPRLDMTYTVFGEVLEGLDIVDMIASVETDSRDKPIHDIKILKMRIVTE